ncbi:MAG TPA: hypothetical protein VJT67_10090 [Longimicrobiaceae bacterium]|nr:hypothetical protein [Longimicrobiaceae bacterium]
MTARDDRGAVERAIALALSDAEVERGEGVAWLLSHPDAAEPVLAEQVRAGTASDPELFLRLLAGIGREESLGAMEAALVRGHPGESFYAAQALAAHPHPAAKSILARHYSRLSDEARRGLDAIGYDVAG